MMDKYLEFIQNIISRMANNSFLIKGWSVTLVAALFALAAKDSNTDYAQLAYFPAIMFAFLDAYYLYQERLFRDLFKEAAANKIEKHDMSTKRYTEGLWGFRKLWKYLRSLLSLTILLFHGGIIIGVVYVNCPDLSWVIKIQEFLQC